MAPRNLRVMSNILITRGEPEINLSDLGFQWQFHEQHRQKAKPQDIVIAFFLILFWWGLGGRGCDAEFSCGFIVFFLRWLTAGFLDLA